jgi:hypothetical protein
MYAFFVACVAVRRPVVSPSTPRRHVAAIRELDVALND